MPRISIGGTRELTVTVDISGQIIRAEQYGAWGVQVSGAVQVSGTVTADISGQSVLISGQQVNVSGQIIRAEQYGAWGVQVSGAVQVSGTVTANISGQSVLISGQPVNVSGQSVLISGQPVNVSGQYIRAVQQGAWGVQVSGAVQVSGTVTANISGQPIDIVTPTLIITNAASNPLRVPSISGGTMLTSADCISVTIKALPNNSGDLYVGGYTTGNMPYSGAGLLLSPGEAVNVDIDNTGKVRIFAVVSGDRVTYIANR